MRHQSTTSLAGAPLHPALDPQGTAMGDILPSSLLPLKEWIRDLSSAPPAPWLVAHVTGVLICPTVSAVGVGSRHRGSVELSHLRLQYGFREMCALGESQGKLDHFMEEKHILPTHPHPPSSPKATSKTDHRDGTEEHALQRGEGKVCPHVARQTQPHSLVRPHTIRFTPPSWFGFSPCSLPNPCRVHVHTSRWWPATGGWGAGSSARAPPWNCLFPPTSCTCSGWQRSRCSGSDTS